jgi:hypothetical protein
VAAYDPKQPLKKTRRSVLTALLSSIAMLKFSMKYILLSFFVLEVTGCTPTSIEDETDVFDALAVSWGWPVGQSSCDTNSVSISFTASNEKMHLSYSLPIKQYDGKEVSRASYDVISETADFLIVRMHGETRENDGKPILWRIRVEGGNSFYWELPYLEDELGEAGRENWAWGPMLKCDP